MDKIIKTNKGDFRVRVNGRLGLVIDPGEYNQEIVRATPLKKVCRNKNHNHVMATGKNCN